MTRKGASLLSNISATGSGDWVYFEGGRAVLVIFGTLATTNALQYQGKDGSTAVAVASPSAAGMTALDLPQGYYRMTLTGGSPSGVYADIAAVAYA